MFHCTQHGIIAHSYSQSIKESTTWQSSGAISDESDYTVEPIRAPGTTGRNPAAAQRKPSGHNQGSDIETDGP